MHLNWSPRPPPRPSPCVPQPLGGCSGLMMPMLQGARSGGLKERMLQGPHHFGAGGLELGVLAAPPACPTSWSPRALGQGIGGGRRRPQPWSPHPLVVVAQAAALHWPMRSALRAQSRAGPTAASDGRWGFRLVHPCTLSPRRQSCGRPPQWSAGSWPPSPSGCAGHASRRTPVSPSAGPPGGSSRPPTSRAEHARRP